MFVTMATNRHEPVLSPNQAKIDEYLEKLLIYGRKKCTVERYGLVLGRFCRDLRSLGYSDDPSEITEDQVYMTLNAMCVSESTKESYAFTIRQWCRYWKNGRVDSIRILTNGDTPNARWISYEQYISVLRCARSKSDTMMIYLGGSYGLRRAEIADLKIDDIHPDRMVVHGKGHGPEGKIRAVPLPDGGDPVILSYMEYRQNLLSFCGEDRSEGCFLVRKSKRTVKRYVPESVGARCRTLMTMAGVDGTTHSLRREFITTAYRSSAQIVDIMQIVGHTDPRQTARYIEKDINNLRKTINLRNQYISKSTCLSEENGEGLI